MISTVRGPIGASGHGFVVVELGGFGVRVEVPVPTATRHHAGNNISLHTSLVVREDSLTLFGFETPDELDVFGKLLSVSGVGPRSALGVLSELRPSEIVAAVIADDEKPFRRVSGIGPKTAKLLVVSLVGKLDHLEPADEPVAADSAAAGESAQVIAGLVGLGWPESHAIDAVQSAIGAGSATDASALMRAALALLQAPRMKGSSR